MVEPLLLAKYTRFLGIGFFMLLGCQKAPIESYIIPKETPPALPAMMATAPSSKLRWTIPKEWTSQPATAMRLASFLINTHSREKCEVSVVSLSGEAGGILANVNRWRGQLQLDPVSESALNNSLSHPKLGSNIYTTTWLHNETKAILVAILKVQDETYFFKLVGNLSDVKDATPAFHMFLASITSRP